MMDKGFVIADLLEKVPASYAIPPFSQMNCQQFEENEVTETQNIARVRIHVEESEFTFVVLRRTIYLIKLFHQILQEPSISCGLFHLFLQILEDLFFRV